MPDGGGGATTRSEEWERRRAKRRRWGRREEPGRERGDRAKTRCPGGERHGDDPVDTNAAMNAGGGAKGTI